MARSNFVRVVVVAAADSDADIVVVDDADGGNLMRMKIKTTDATGKKMKTPGLRTMTMTTELD